MSAGKIYKVVLDLSTTGSLDAPLARTATAANHASTNLSHVRDEIGAIGASMANAFTGAVEKVGAMAASIGMVAGAAGLGGLVYGVGHLNSELEKTTISLATIFSANGLAGSMPAGMALAGDMMKQIRHDAAALPGETEDLIGIFRSISIPGAQAGGTAAQLEKLSANLMASGAVAGLDQQMVAREAAQLLSGRSGSHNVLGSRLFGLTGDKAEAFNAKSGADRLKFLEEGTKKYGASIAYFNGTMDAQWSTMVDNMKNAGREATKPLFESVKRTLSEVNGWFDHNADTVEDWAHKIGDRIAEAWDWGTKKIAEWWPAIQKFAGDAYSAISGLWTEFGPSISEAANALKGALADGSALEKIESILKLYSVVKVGGGLSSVAGTAGKLGSALGGLGGAGGAEAGAVGALANPVGLAVTGAMIVDGLALAGAMHAAADSTSEYHDKATAGFSKLSTQWDTFTDTLSVSVMPALEKFGVTMLQVAGDELQAVNWILDKAQKVNDRHDGMYGGGDTIMHHKSKGGASGMHFGRDMLAVHGKAWEDRGIKPGIGGGAGVTNNIARVEIVMNSSNQDPGRLAEMVVDKLTTLNRHPKVASRTPNYSMSNFERSLTRR